MLLLISGLGITWYLLSKETTLPGGVEVVAHNLEVPWSLAFAPDGRLFFTERVGRVNVLARGEVRTLLRLEVEAAPGEEGGLLGLTLDPGFDQNRFLYVYYTYRDERGQRWNRVSRFTESSNSLLDESVVIDQIPGHGFHDGGRIKFGPDGKLYVTTGDAGRGELAQNLGSLAGKILRIDPDGTIPGDNPFPNSPVFSLGHRNPQGLAWHPVTGALYSTEHGPSGESGYVAHDEVNLIEAGGNYGWPHIIGRGNDSRFVDSVYETGQTTWAPSGATFYNGTRYPQWSLRLFIATLRGQHLRMVTLSPPTYTRVESTTALYQGTFGRLRDVAQGPDGYLYLATSNRDGRGSPEATDDRILRIATVPALPVGSILPWAPTVGVAYGADAEQRTWLRDLNGISRGGRP